jgi:large subunit ribosomal protein L25
VKQDQLKVNARDIKGKKVRFLRREGITPINLYGPNIDSIPLQAETAAIKRLITKSGRNAMISLEIDGEKKGTQVLLRDVQCDPMNGKLLHIDLFKVDMNRKIRVDVPIQFIGESKAAKSKRGMLIENLASLHVEALPGDLPQNIEVDISGLIELGQAIFIRDLKLDPKITVLNEPGQVIAKVMEAKVEVEPVAVAAEGEAVEGEEGEAAEGAEGEAKEGGEEKPAAEAKGKTEAKGKAEVKGKAEAGGKAKSKAK